MNLLLRSILATAMLLPFDAIVENAEAASPGTCNKFIGDLKGLAARAQAAQCGGGWDGFNENESMRWCRRVKEETIRDTLHTERQNVGKCTTCRGYSNRANQAARDAAAYRCGFSGDRWGIGSGDANDGHFQWCRSLSTTTTGFGMEYAAGIPLTPWDTARGEEEGARNAGIKACMAGDVRGRFSEDEQAKCHDYANEAVLKANFNANKKCGANIEGRWTLLKEEHFIWCLPRTGNDAGRAMIESETGIRETGAQHCSKGGTLTAAGDPFRGPPIKKLGKRGGNELKPDQVNIEPGLFERPRDVRTGSNPPKTKKVVLPPGGAGKKSNAGSGGTSGSGGAMDRLGAGSGNVPNIAPQPTTGSGGPGLVAGEKKRPGSGFGGTAPANNAPAATTKPPLSSGAPPPAIIDYGGTTSRGGTKVR